VRKRSEFDTTIEYYLPLPRRIYIIDEPYQTIFFSYLSFQRRILRRRQNIIFYCTGPKNILQVGTIIIIICIRQYYEIITYTHNNNYYYSTIVLRLRSRITKTRRTATQSYYVFSGHVVYTMRLILLLLLLL
jgi:hypothetical protein